MTPSEYQDLVALIVKKFGEVEGRLANIEVGFGEFRLDLKTALELTTANGQAIRENLRLIERSGVRIDQFEVLRDIRLSKAELACGEGIPHEQVVAELRALHPS